MSRESRSLDTVLLHVFHTLAASGRSFSVGAIAFENNGMYDQLTRAGFTPAFDGEWCEYTLRTPLGVTCPCEPCQRRGAPKLAVDFMLVGHEHYILLKLKTFTSSSLTGLIEMAGIALGMPSHNVIGCHNRSCARAVYAFGAYDLETYELILPQDQLEGAKQEHAQYNACRQGNEFFIPSHCLRLPSVVV